MNITRSKNPSKESIADATDPTCRDCEHDNGRRGEYAQCNIGEHPNDNEPVCAFFQPR